MCVKLSSLLESEMRVFYITQVLTQDFNIKTMCPNYILEFRNAISYLFHVYLSVWVTIKIVIENHVC